MAITIRPSRSDGGGFAIPRVITVCSVRSRHLGSTLGAAVTSMAVGECDHRLPVRHFREGHVRDGDLRVWHRSSEGIMRVTGLTANLPVADIATASEFYREYLGLSVEAMNLGWVARYASADGRASVQLVTGDASAPQDSVISVHVGSDVDEAYAEARRRGYEIVHPLTDEPWGVRRFFVRAPDGNIINIVSHSDE